MNDLALHIEYLLLRHDCVVVPGFGAFLAHTDEARIDELTGILYPPSRHLGFNGDVRINDGLLAQSVARREHVTLETAVLQISEAVTAFNARLSEGQPLEVGRLGTMTLSEDVLLFTPSANSVIGIPYCGLNQFRPALLPAENISESEIEEDREPERTAPYFPSWLKVAASVMVAFVTLGLVFSTTNLADRTGREQASLDSGLRRSVERVAVESEDVLALSREIILNIASPAKAEEVKAATPKPSRYILVVGSFPTQRQALRFIGNNPELSYLENDGNFRVYAASAATINQANALADSLRPAYANVWVCRR